MEEPEGPKEQLTVRLVVPSELQLAYSLPYKDKKALIEFNHTQEFQVATPSHSLRRTEPCTYATALQYCHM